jgi:transketolase
MGFPEKIVVDGRARLLKMHFESGVGHIGGNLSCLDSLLVLYHRILNEQDRFILSKGHAAGALYTALWSIGHLTDEDLKTFHKEGTRLSGHPSPHFGKNVPFATGSLGHGFSLAAGLALSKKIRSEKGRVYCLTSDGEGQEGSSWEALIFTVKQNLEAVTLMVDWNGLQGFGDTMSVAGMGSLQSRFEAFGLPTQVVDGHDFDAIEKALAMPIKGPRAILLKTVKGHGVSFMENRMEWHYLPMTEGQYQQALRELSPP